MTKYKLYYANYRALGEPIRLIFTYSGVEFEDIRWSLDDWSKYKPLSPTGLAPWLEVDGIKIPEAFAIYRFLGRRFGLAGKNEFESTKIDSTADFYRWTMEDSRPYTWVITDRMEGDKDKLYNEDFLPAVTKSFNYVIDIIKHSKSGYIVDSGISWADFYIAENMVTMFNMDPTLKSKFPEVIDYVEKVHNCNENVREYIKNRKFYMW